MGTKASWPEVQESTSKVLKAIEQNNVDALGLVYWDMVRHILITLSYLNTTPYTTFATYIEQARNFKFKPDTLEQLLDPLKEGFKDLQSTKRIALITFEKMEQLMYQSGIKPYAEKLELFSETDSHVF